MATPAFPANPAPPASPPAEPGTPRGRARTLKRAALIVLGVALFLAISFELARYLSTENVERDDDLALIQAQARGDVDGMLRALSGCSASPSCVATVRADAARLRRPGSVKIVSLKSSTAYSLGSATGTTRLAWVVIGRLPVVQCVKVHRTGSVLSGINVELLSVSAPIPNEADC